MASVFSDSRPTSILRRAGFWRLSRRPEGGKHGPDGPLRGMGEALSRDQPHESLVSQVLWCGG